MILLEPVGLDSRNEFARWCHFITVRGRDCMGLPAGST